MIARLRIRPALIAAAMVLGAHTASAEPHTRSGFCAGLGLGLESASWADADGRDAEWAGAGALRVGYAVRPNLVVGLEFWNWMKQYDVVTGPQTVTLDVILNATTVAVVYYPGSAGWFVRVGAGVAYGQVDEGDTFLYAPEPESETGLAALVSPGYEWRLTTKFALGAQGDVVYLGLGDPVKDAFGYGVSAQFNWYW